VADLFPTLLDLAGIDRNQSETPELDGQSLVPLLNDPQATLNREALYFHYPHYYPTTTPVSAIRAGDWKLLEFHEDNHVELYNLRDDPSETHDLASKQPEKAADLRDQLSKWRTGVGAKMPTKNPR
jgi:arylsulfatase A-like enzyme